MTCDSTRSQSGPTCVCKNGYYDDGTNAVCLPCSYTCATCTSSIICTSCDSLVNFRIYNSTTSTCSCLPNYFNTNNVKTCTPCD